MTFLAELYQRLFSDFVRVYRVLPSRLRRRTSAVFALVFLLACLEVCTIIFISILAISIATPEKLHEMSIFARLMRLFPALEFLKEDPRLFALSVSLLVTLFIGIKNAMAAVVSRRTAILGEQVALFCGETVFRHYLYSPYSAHLSGESGNLLHALACRILLGTMVIYLMNVYTYAVISVFLLAALISATPDLLLLLILSMIFFFSVIYKCIKGTMDKAGEVSAEHSRLEGISIMNATQGIREVLIYRQHPVFFRKFREACAGGATSRSFLAMAPSIPTWVLETAGFFVIPIALWTMYAFQDASMARITGVLTMIMLVSWRVLPLMNRSLSSLVSVRGLRYAALECLKMVEVALADPIAEPIEPDPHFNIRKSVAFEHVDFSYPKAEHACLRNLSFSIPCGARVGIIGPSGSGKSTIMAILSGLLQPSSGNLLIDGKPLSAAALAAYAMQIGYVPQTPYIIPGTLAENVAFSQWGKPFDKERVKNACRMAALDLVETRGIDMPIGERGAGLSGGEAQRLSIARALYPGPSILLLDEATSSLDIGVESSIMNTIFSLPKTITTVIIAHRLSTVEHCDTLLWLDSGTLIESGPPDVVLEHFRKQTSGKNYPV